MKRCLIRIFLCLCAAVLVAQLLRTQTKKSAGSNIEKEAERSSAMNIKEASGVTNNLKGTPVYYNNIGSTRSVEQDEAPQDDISKANTEYGKLPVGKIGTGFYPSPLVLSVQLPSSSISKSHITSFVALVNKDLLRVSDIISAGDFKLQIFNLSQWANIDDPKLPIVWRVYFNGMGESVSSIMKQAYTDSHREEEVKGLGYDVVFRGGSINKIIGRNQDLVVSTYTNGALKQYSWRDNEYNWHVVSWDEKGSITKEYIEGPGRTIAAKKNIIELFKNDPRKSNYVNEVKAQLEAIKSATEEW